MERNDQFYFCGCGSHGLQVERDEDEIYFSFWEYGQPCEVTLWYKIKTMWHILRTGTPYRDQISISHSDGLKLGSWLLEISQAQRYQEIEDFLDKKLDK